MGDPAVEAFVAWLWPRGLSDEELAVYRGTAERFFARAAPGELPLPRDVEAVVAEAEHEEGTTFEERVELRRVADAFLKFRAERCPRRAQLIGTAPAPKVPAAPLAPPTPPRARRSLLVWAIVAVVVLGVFARIVVRVGSSARAPQAQAAPETVQDDAWLRDVLYVSLDPAAFLALQQKVAQKEYGTVGTDDLAPRLTVQAWNGKARTLRAVFVYRDERAVPSGTTYMAMTAARLVGLATGAPEVEAIVVDPQRSAVVVPRDDFARVTTTAPALPEPPMQIRRRPSR